MLQQEDNEGSELGQSDECSDSVSSSVIVQAESDGGQVGVRVDNGNAPQNSDEDELPPLVGLFRNNLQDDRDYGGYIFSVRGRYLQHNSDSMSDSSPEVGEENDSTESADADGEPIIDQHIIRNNLLDDRDYAFIIAVHGECATHSDENDSTESAEAEDEQCSICLQEMEIPFQLPCSHVFCYMCAKGLAKTCGSCALCRGPIPDGYFERPEWYLLSSEFPEPSAEYSWFYEGSEGWWLFTPRVAAEIQEAGKDAKEIVIGGIVCYLKNNIIHLSAKDRLIKRDLSTSANVGVAGINREHFRNIRQRKRRHEEAFPNSSESVESDRGDLSQLAL
ncbi:Hypothetical predicted protein [Cloeon dipterum]|uniref:E3 ubiquitin-protein ligase n=1 Tax=Cloeon dipterum TaxID=197152 RepID=A0A8S1BUH9_9INSE|nr:Hypothetical predicted protein [Cloeon dipterum]